MKRKVLIVLLALLVAGCGQQVVVQQVDIIPEPVFMVQKEGTFTLHTNPKVSVLNVGQNSATVKYIMKSLRQQHLRPKLVAPSENYDIELVLYDTLNMELGDEGYLLEVRQNGIRLSANTETGLLYAYQTLAQILPQSSSDIIYASITLPECTILDYPRYDWRGLMLNVSGRALRPKEMRRVVEAMAAYKMNRLSVDGGRWTEDSLLWVVDSLTSYSKGEMDEFMVWAGEMGVKIVLRDDTVVQNDSAGVVLMPDDCWALDCYQADMRYQPEANEGVQTLGKAYQGETFKRMTAEATGHGQAVAGGEARLLTDCIGNQSETEYMILPRLLAVSEVLWSPEEKQDWSRFRRKVEEHKLRLGQRGYNYCEGSFTPQFEARRVDSGTMNIAIGTEVPNTYIFYTTDMSCPTRSSAIYIGPMNLKRGTHIKILPVYKDKERDSVYEFVIK
ncbi:MAG: family 20 glycosylhydrolase [Bacteroidales bacterium]|nr:family 20 glycosylhydrolase [Bacteroidales bacterium]